ncbi:MAG: cytochrome P450 [Myxococcota bacterium]
MPNHPTRPEIQLLDGSFYAADPHPHFEWMRDNAPLYWDETWKVWGVTRHADIMACSKQPGLFCSGQGSRPDSPPIPSMINLDDPIHKRRRNLVNSGFTPRQVNMQEAKIREICRELVDRALDLGEFDFVTEVAAPLPMIVIGDMLGVAPEDRDKLLRWSDDLILGTSGTAMPEAAVNAAKSAGEYVEYAREVIADRRGRPPQDDLMSVLVHAEIDGQSLDDDALVQESLLILVGGDETTRHVISGGMEQLIRNPDQLQKLVDDASKIPTAVEEMLRWVTPIQNMSRTATRNVELRGETIRKGDRLLMLYPSGNRDEAVFEAPNRFDVERSPNDHVAFGGYGAHFCLGAPLARLELRVMFEELIGRAAGLEFVKDEPLPIRKSNFIAGIERMDVRVGSH